VSDGCGCQVDRMDGLGMASECGGISIFSWTGVRNAQAAEGMSGKPGQKAGEGHVVYDWCDGGFGTTYEVKDELIQYF
jgi:hypothetical protein